MATTATPLLGLVEDERSYFAAACAAADVAENWPWILTVSASLKAAYALIMGSWALLQVGAGVFILKNPYGTLFAVTIWIGIMVLIDGIYHCALCCGNRNLRGWGFTLASGLASVVLAVIILSGLPETSLYTIGILVGTNFLMVGNVRIHVAMEGRSASAVINN
eukprot:CAMPEP_0178688216 /NCGR_PEP_ID=MMETSP0699-20121125/4873_1 /TAXON_ID=265572 /ORGANISM="Extubocellulus spinifer, Strain CCMP396" /LENGTH=163 /DNA_ID=CAMNT_0020333171 /DNA_START=204 /DNA_END=694 /DNA_ORIENTATION=-